MRQIQVQDRQNIVDIAIQYYGCAASVFDLIVDNGLELDTTLVAGQMLLIEDTYPASANGTVADYLQGNGVVVVSMDEASDGNALGTDDGAAAIITNDDNYIGV
jgi:hypothetical protein